jgi:hypothetical protein
MIVRENVERHCRYLCQKLIRVGASAAAGISSQRPLQTDASSSQAAEIVKITGFDKFLTLMLVPPIPVSSRVSNRGTRPRFARATAPHRANAFPARRGLRRSRRAPFRTAAPIP